MSFISAFYSCVFVKNRINLELFIYFFEHDIMNISYSQYEKKPTVWFSVGSVFIGVLGWDLAFIFSIKRREDKNEFRGQLK